MIIGLGGGTGSGKSAIVHSLAARVGVMSRSVGPHIRLDPSVVKALSACDGLEASIARCSSEGGAACRGALVAVYERMDRERNEAEGLVSTCELMMPPGLALEAGRCVTR